MTVKERNLLKGAIRRVFSRSDLRRKLIESHTIEGYSDINRPRVTKWGYCTECGEITPRYKLEVDHEPPIVPIGKRLEDMTWDELIDNLWCNEINLRPMCKDCHKAKSKAEMKKRKA